MVKRLLILVLFFSAAALPSSAQKVSAAFGEGINILAADSSMSMKFSTRFQTLFVAQRELTEDADIETAMMIRRFRLKFDGFAFDPRLVYKIELALSNRDNSSVIPQGSDAANIVLDAILKYRAAKNTEIWVGQFKLPGNRERVISSQALQFVDRSLVNDRFNLDRDVGVMLNHKFKLGNIVFRDMWAVSMGQGRNITMEDDGGLNYTGRIEILPFGDFTFGGDYFSSDLVREVKPKLSVGAGYSYNDEAMRERGELGDFMPPVFMDQRQDLSTIFADVMFKYSGFSLHSEYMNKQAENPVLSDTTGNSFNYYTGDGFVVQAGYLFKNNIELSGRYTTINPAKELFEKGLEHEQTQYTFGVSKYFSEHNLKIQSDISYTGYDMFTGSRSNDLMYRFQVELAL